MSTLMLHYMAKGRKQRVAPKSYYSLTDVVQKINDGQVLIKPNAERDAYQLFGWVVSDIKDAYRKLQPRHFYKTDPSKAKAGVYLDFYKATINGERIYTHFYINDKSNLLVINSFKEQ
jgi:hypothetical protein